VLSVSVGRLSSPHHVQLPSPCVTLSVATPVGDLTIRNFFNDVSRVGKLTPMVRHPMATMKSYFDISGGRYLIPTFAYLAGPTNGSPPARARSEPQTPTYPRMVHVG
jgi:hypothetical protein